MTTPEDWHEIHGPGRDAWRDTFNPDRSSLDLPSACPVCGSRSLHRWYYLDERRPRAFDGVVFLGPGRLWEWCSDCHTYEHFQDTHVPPWWECSLVVPEDELRYDPGPIEEARLAATGGESSGTRHADDRGMSKAE